LGSYLRDALHEGSADMRWQAFIPVPQALVFSSFPLFTWWSAAFSCKKVFKML
jgi:hypothetical protein